MLHTAAPGHGASRKARITPLTVGQMRGGTEHCFAVLGASTSCLQGSLLPASGHVVLDEEAGWRPTPRHGKAPLPSGMKDCTEHHLGCLKT